MKVGLIAAALGAVVLGAVVAYGWASSGSQLWAIGLGIMIAGTVGLAGVLVRTVFGLRHPGRARRPELVTPFAPFAPVQVRRPAPVEMPAPAALQSNSAASRRFAGYGAAD